jgi:Fe-S-cluster containining protein
MNRHERRRLASVERRGASAESTAPLDPLSAEVTNEWAGAKTEAAAIGAATRATETMDQRLAEVWEESGTAPACKRGCSYCCTVPVSVTAPEVIRLVAYARETLPPEELARVKERAEANARETHGTTALGYPPRLDCAFLGADRACLVHSARPLMCRREHAMDVAQCKTAYDLAAPGKDSPIDRLVPAKLASDVVLDAYHNGLAASGVDPSDYELQEAAHIALSGEDAIARWLNGEETFASARVNRTIDKRQIPTPRAPRRFFPSV